MKHVKLIGACAVAVFALLAVAASAAYAEGPEWGRCVAAAKGTKGRFEDANCTKEKFKEKKGVKTPDGKYEWKAGAPAKVECEAKKDGNYTESGCKTVAEKKGVPDHKGKFEKYGPKFTGEGGKGVLSAHIYACRIGTEEESHRHPRSECENGGRHPKEYENEIGGLEVECASEHAIGEALNSDEVANVAVRFNGCVIFGSNPCKSPGAAAEEIRTETLKGRLGYIEKAAAKVGVLLEPATAGGRFANLECENIEARVSVGVGSATEGAWYTPEATGGYDGIISPITPVNTMTTTFTQEYTANANHENIPSHFEGGHIELLETYLESEEAPAFESSAWSPAGQEITNVNTVEGEEEIKG